MKSGFSIGKIRIKEASHENLGNDVASLEGDTPDLYTKKATTN